MLGTSTGPSPSPDAGPGPSCGTDAVLARCVGSNPHDVDAIILSTQICCCARASLADATRESTSACLLASASLLASSTDDKTFAVVMASEDCDGAYATCIFGFEPEDE